MRILKQHNEQSERQNKENFPKKIYFLVAMAANNMWQGFNLNSELNEKF